MCPRPPTAPTRWWYASGEAGAAAWLRWLGLASDGARLVPWVSASMSSAAMYSRSAARLRGTAQAATVEQQRSNPDPARRGWDPVASEGF